MIFGIIAISLKHKIIAIISTVSGSMFLILWGATALANNATNEMLLGAIMLITITSLPDLILGIVTLRLISKKAKVSLTNNINSSEDI